LKLIYDGVFYFPNSFGTTNGSSFFRIAMQQFVVPKSIPTRIVSEL